MVNVGLLGGMFDPIHAGHVAMAEAALRNGMDEVLLLPCQTPAHRPQALASARHRLAMCHLAAAGHPGIKADDTDLRDGPCYAVDTVRLLQAKRPEARFHWILGADKLPALAAWRDSAALFALCDFLVCPRPGHDAGYPVDGAALRVLPLEPVAASSGMAIAQIRAYNDAPGLLPVEIARYIAENGLYLPDYADMLRKRGMGEKRLAHTLSVRREAVRLARKFGAGMVKAAVAAMLHDAAKPLSLGDMRALAARYDMALPDDVLAQGNLLHGPLSAQIALREFGVDQPEILSAIACHTTGKPGMTALDLCLFVADAIEPLRADYPGLAEIRQLAEYDLPQAALCAMRHTREYVLSRGKPFCQKTDEAMRYIIKNQQNTPI